MTPIPMIAEPYEPDLSRPESRPNRAIDVPVPTDKPAFSSFAQLRDFMRRRFDRLWALDVEYVFNAESYCEDPGLVPFGRYRYAFRHEKRLKIQSNNHDGSLVYPSYIWAWNGDIQQDFHAQLKNADHEAKKSDWLNSDIYLCNACIPCGSVEDEYTAAKNTCTIPLLQRVFDARWRWKVLPKLEAVEGAPCHVIESNDRVRLWVDPALDCAVRIVAWGTMSRVALRDFRLMADNLWMPWRTEAVGYDPKLSPFPDGGSYAAVSIVTSMTVNDEVPEGHFTLNYACGTVMRDCVNKLFYRLGDHLERIKLGDMN